MENEIITTRSLARNFVEVKQDLVLKEEPQTRIVFKAQLCKDGIRGKIFRYKKDIKGNCEEIIPADFRQLHANEGIGIELSTDAVKILYQKIEELKRLLEEQGIRYGEHDFSISGADALVITDQNKATVIRKLLEDNSGEEFWNQLAQNDPDVATRLANSQLQADRTTVLRRFETMLTDENLPESDWQNFFENNTWIFGYGLRYQILRILHSQPNYGGSDVSGSGGQRGDFLTTTEAEKKFTCLVEIKKPNTLLLQNSEYRNGVWGVSSELSGAVSQVQINCAKWEIEGARTDQNRDLMADICTISPKGIVVIGDTNQLGDRDKRNSFERYRREIHNPEIVTYDELYERAKYIIGEHGQVNE
jgi:hypothetical protein